MGKHCLCHYSLKPFLPPPSAPISAEGACGGLSPQPGASAAAFIRILLFYPGRGGQVTHRKPHYGHGEANGFLPLPGLGSGVPPPLLHKLSSPWLAPGCCPNEVSLCDRSAQRGWGRRGLPSSGPSPAGSALPGGRLCLRSSHAASSAWGKAGATQRRGASVTHRNKHLSAGSAESRSRTRETVFLM